MKRLFVSSAVAAMAVASMSANADVLAMSDLTINSFFVVDRSGAPVTTGITIQSETRRASDTVTYNGVTDFATASSTTLGVTVDPRSSCAGPACLAVGAPPIGIGYLPANDSTTHVKTVTSNYAFGDAFLAGSALSGDAGANAITRADTQSNELNVLADANASVQNGVTTLTTFAVGTTQDLAFALTYNAFVKAFVDTGLLQQATAGNTWALTLSSLSDILFQTFTFNPAELNVGFTSNTPGNNQEFEQSGFLTSNFFTVRAGNSYSLRIQQDSQSIISQQQSIPEPGTLLLTALALIGLGASTLKRGVAASRR